MDVHENLHLRRVVVLDKDSFDSALEQVNVVLALGTKVENL